MNRCLTLVLSTLLGIALGLAADLTVLTPTPPIGDVAGALLLSPIAVTFGGGAVTPSYFASLLFFSGLVFWPVYGFLAVRWVRRGTPWLWLAIFGWCAQGFYRVVTRLYALMSV